VSSKQIQRSKGNPRITVIGLGSIGLRHARNLLAAGADVVGLDPDPERCSLLAEAGGKPEQSRESALEHADGVVIASPSAHHFQDLADVAHRGCHVFIEKPLAHTDNGLEDILREFERHDRIVFAGLNLRFNPTAQSAQRLVAEGTLGKVLWARFQLSDYLPNWRPHQDHRKGYAADPVSGGVLFDVIHEFDLANFILGQAKTVAAASGNSATLGIAAEDSAEVILRHNSGVLSTLHLDYVTRPRQRVTEIAGSEANLRLDLDARTVSLSDLKGTLIDMIPHAGEYATDYEAEMTSFLACMAGQQSPPCDGWQALDILRQVLAARRFCALPETDTPNT